MKSVKTSWVLNLSGGTKVFVKKGDKVAVGQVLAQSRVSEEKIFYLPPQLVKIMGNFLGKYVKKGDVIGEIGTFFKKKIISPVEGEIVKIDEYNNVYLKSAEEKIKAIVCPTDAIVTDVNDENLSLEFKAVEFEGEGLSEGRVWGNNGIKEVSRVTDLSVSDVGKIIMVDELLPALISKAEVVGICGVVTLNSDRINTRLPILKVNSEEYENILSEYKKAKRAILNANSGRLLLVI